MFSLEEEGPSLLTQGQHRLIQKLLAHNLVDQINTFTFPVIFGAEARSYWVLAQEKRRFD